MHLIARSKLYMNMVFRILFISERHVWRRIIDGYIYLVRIYVTKIISNQLMTASNFFSGKIINIEWNSHAYLLNSCWCKQLIKTKTRHTSKHQTFPFWCIYFYLSKYGSYRCNYTRLGLLNMMLFLYLQISLKLYLRWKYDE